MIILNWQNEQTVTSWAGCKPTTQEPRSTLPFCSKDLDHWVQYLPEFCGNWCQHGWHQYKNSLL